MAFKFLEESDIRHLKFGTDGFVRDSALMEIAHQLERIADALEKANTTIKDEETP